MVILPVLRFSVSSTCKDDLNAETAKLMRPFSSHRVPRSVVESKPRGAHLDRSGSQVQVDVQVTVQELHGEVILPKEEAYDQRDEKKAGARFPLASPLLPGDPFHRHR